MSTQTAVSVVGNNQMSKVFSGTATDGAWTNLQDTLSSSNLGILIPNAGVNRVSANYTAGCGAWRIINAQTLAVSRRGWASKMGYNCYKTNEIPTHRVGPNEIIQIFTRPVDSTSSKSNVVAWVHTSKGTELYEKLAVADNTATEIKTALQDQSLGDAAFNSTLTSMSFQVEDGGKLVMVEIIDSAGGTIYTQMGNFRLQSAGGTSAYYNFDASGLGIQIGKGFSLKVTTVTA